MGIRQRNDVLKRTGRVVNKVLSRWQKLWSRQRIKKIKKLLPWVQLASAESASY